MLLLSSIQYFTVVNKLPIMTSIIQLQVFSTFEELGISVDCVATSEVSISLTLDPAKVWSRELIQQASVGPPVVS